MLYCNGMRFTLCAGLPFKRPQPASPASAVCAHLRLSLSPEECKLISQIKHHCSSRTSTQKAVATNNPPPPQKNRSKNGAKQDHRSNRIPPLIQGEFAEIALCIATADSFPCMPFGKSLYSDSRLSAWVRGPRLILLYINTSVAPPYILWLDTGLDITC